MNQENKNESLEITQDQLEEIRQRAIEEAKEKKHNWRQKGNMIYCKSCDYPHGFYIPPEKMMVGIDKEGMPVIKDKRFIRGR